MKIGIFDSGIGGQAVAAALKLTFPETAIETVDDRANLPYGSKEQAEVIRLTDATIQPLLGDGCDVIVIACNTATALAISWLRQKYPSQSFIGFEPMIKPAVAMTKTNIVAVCATPATLASQHYRQQVENYGSGLQLIEPDCSQWASWIEDNQINRGHVQEIIEDACQRGADVIVLGCTHYHWIKDIIIELVAGRAEVIEPTEAIGRRVHQLLGDGSELFE